MLSRPASYNVALVPILIVSCGHSILPFSHEAYPPVVLILIPGKSSMIMLVNLALVAIAPSSSILSSWMSSPSLVRACKKYLKIQRGTCLALERNPQSVLDLASMMLMGVIFYVVYTKGLRGFSGVAIGGIVALDILFLAFISGASMNPARALAPALLSGTFGDLWLYWTAPFIGTLIAAFLFRGKFRAQRAQIRK